MIDDPLYIAVRRFVADQKISCPETIHQCDWVILNAYEFIQELCEIVGYHRNEEVDE